MTSRALVVDDEALARQRVCDLVRAHPALTLAGEASDGASALDRIAAERPDLVFLDVQMPELDGFQVVSALAAECADGALPAVVFVTAYDEYAVRAFEVDAVDYLLKPVREERFAAAVARVFARRDRPDAAVRALAERATRERGTPFTRFVARRGNRHYFVPVADVEWIAAVGNYVRLQTGERSHLVRDTMKAVEARLDPDAFARIHRSVLVAVNRIRSIEAREHGEWLVTMRGGRRFASSRSYAERVRALLR